MTVEKRSLVIGSLFVISLAFYGAAKFYSPILVRYVVEQSLLQKAPPGITPASLRAQFHAFLAAVPDKNSQMERLLRISEYLEKVQRLDLKQLNGLLAVDAVEKPGISRSSRGFPEDDGG